MLTLNSLSRAERFVTEQQKSGNDVRWDGWDIVFFRGDPENPQKTAHGYISEDGAFRNGVWGFENRVPVSDSGVWEIDYRNVKRTRRTKRNRA